jgi:membrane fusion protein, multidrug efflux system
MYRVISAGFLLAGFLLQPTCAVASEISPMRGVIKAINEAAISSDIGTRITELPFREGQSFKKNDLLIAFDCERLQADTKAAEAERRGHHAAWENSARLYQLRAAGAHEVTMAAATHDKSAAIVEGLQAKAKHCRVLAPFDGRVLDLNVRKHETPSPSQPLIRILDDQSLEIDMLLPASSVSAIKTGVKFELTLDETNKVIKGEITRVGAALDIVSQTFKASGTLTSDKSGVLPGMSGSITIKSGAM